MRKLWVLFLFRLSLEAYSIIFIHLGTSLPLQLPIVIQQARIFNRECEIYLVANQSALRTSPQMPGVISVACETLIPSSSHLHFRRTSTLDRQSANGFWFYTSERFYYLEEFMRSRNLSDVFHLENDVMLYTDLASLLPQFQNLYPNKIATTFEQDFRCVPGFLYIPNIEPLTKLTEYMAQRAHFGDADMELIGWFKRTYSTLYLDALPTMTPDYIADHRPLCSRGGVLSQEPDWYCLHFEAFKSIFDAASLGIYLAGEDSRYRHETGAGTIHANSVFLYNPKETPIAWDHDAEERLFPVLLYKGKATRINNLHITNKSCIPYFYNDNLSGKILKLGPS